MHYVCTTGDVIDGIARGFEVNNQKVIVIKVDQDLRVYLNQCPHLKIPLEWQEDDFMEPDGELLRCSTHGALFLPDTGECISGPCSGDFLQAIPFVTRDNGVWIL